MQYLRLRAGGRGRTAIEPRRGQIESSYSCDDKAPDQTQSTRESQDTELCVPAFQ